MATSTDTEPESQKKHLLQRCGGQVHQLLGQLYRWLVGQTAKHNVGHAIDLLAGSPVEAGVTIAVDTGPPGGHAID